MRTTLPRAIAAFTLPKPTELRAAPLTAERFEVESLDAFEKMKSGQGALMDAKSSEQMNELMKGYHDLVEFGRREVYKLEN